MRDCIFAKRYQSTTEPCAVWDISYNALTGFAKETGSKKDFQDANSRNANPLPLRISKNESVIDERLKRAVKRARTMMPSG